MSDTQARLLLHDKLRIMANERRKKMGDRMDSTYEQLMDFAGEAAFLCLLPARMQEGIEELQAEIRRLKGEAEPEAKVQVAKPQLWTPGSDR